RTTRTAMRCRIFTRLSPSILAVDSLTRLERTGWSLESGVSARMVTARYAFVRIRPACESAGYFASVFVRTLVGGTTVQRMNVSQAFPASASLIVAPAVEYNWSGKAGVIVGARVVPLGRNAAATFAPVAAINLVY